MASPNILAGIAAGGGVLEGAERAQQRTQRNELMRFQREDRQRQSQLLKAFPGAVAGDQNALALVAQSDPQTFMDLQTHHAKLAEAKRAEQQQRVQQFAGASLYGLENVRKAPAEQRQALYQQTVQQLQQLDPETFQQLGGAPQQYDESFVQAVTPRLLAIALGPEGMAKYATGGDAGQPRDDRTATQREAESYTTDPNFRTYVDRPQRISIPEGYQPTPGGGLAPIEGAPASSTLDKRLFDVNDAAFKARSSEEQYANIAGQMERELPAAGVGAKWTESLKAITGEEDAVTNLRKQWNNLRVSAAVKNLPPGVASDKDIELVMSAFLPEFANPEAVASFMRGLSKLEKVRGDYHEFEAEYLSSKRTPVGLNKAWREKLNTAPDAGEQPQGGAAPTQEQTKTVGGKTYVKRGNDWFEQ
jgi:hypothetical protein